MDFFVNHIWEIIFGLVASGALGFCKYLHSQSKNYQKLLADKENDNLRNTIQDELEPIIEEIHRRFVVMARSKNLPEHRIQKMMILRDGQVHMANLAIIGSYSVNGVAFLHTEILKNDVMKDFYHIYPEKFNNKTNGVTHRRWLVYSNPQLRELLNETIGDSYINNPADLEKLILSAPESYLFSIITYSAEATTTLQSLSIPAAIE